jgi:hypothetical protein
MNETQKLAFAIKGVHGMQWLAEQLKMSQPTLKGRMYGITSFRLDEMETIQELYNDLTTK